MLRMSIVIAATADGCRHLSTVVTRSGPAAAALERDHRAKVLAHCARLSTATPWRHGPASLREADAVQPRGRSRMSVVEIVGVVIGIVGLLLMICLGMATAQKRKRGRRQR